MAPTEITLICNFPDNVGIYINGDERDLNSVDEERNLVEVVMDRLQTHFRNNELTLKKFHCYCKGHNNQEKRLLDLLRVFLESTNAPVPVESFLITSNDFSQKMTELVSKLDAVSCKHLSLNHLDDGFSWCSQMNFEHFTSLDSLTLDPIRTVEFLDRLSVKKCKFTILKDLGDSDEEKEKKVLDIVKDAIEYACRVGVGCDICLRGYLPTIENLRQLEYDGIKRGQSDDHFRFMFPRREKIIFVDRRLSQEKLTIKCGDVTSLLKQQNLNIGASNSDDSFSSDDSDKEEKRARKSDQPENPEKEQSSTTSISSHSKPNQHKKAVQKMYEEHQAKEAPKKAQSIEEKEKAQQQAMLDSLTRQIPVMLNVVTSSTSPDSLVSSSSSAVSSNEEDQITVKDVLVGKFQAITHRHSSPHDAAKSYRPRGSRERVLFEEYLYVFDKLSYDAKKKLFRCERKNTCPARVHTPVDSERVIHRVQTQNHPPPTHFDLAHYEIDFGKITSGYIMTLNGTQHHLRNWIPTTLLTPKSEVYEILIPNFYEKSQTPPMDILTKMAQQLDGLKPVKLRLPGNFNKLSKFEVYEMEMDLTKFLLQQTEPQKELMSKKGYLPVFFPNAQKKELVLVVADFNQENCVHEMIRVKNRNEISFRTAIPQHLQQVSTRSLMINFSFHFIYYPDSKNGEFN